MPSLAEFQFTLAADLLDGGMRTARLLPGDPALIREALRVHRNTVLAGLAKALRLTYPTVVWLTGEDFFNQAALEFSGKYPPRSACLSDYGCGFAEFLEDYSPARGLPYLADVARFDLVIERCAHAGFGVPNLLTLDRDTAIERDSSLVTLTVEYPVDRLRDAYDSNDTDSLEYIDMSPRARHFAVWASENGVSVRLLSVSAASFLGAVLQGESAKAALSAALLHADAVEALTAIQNEIFAAPFLRILSQPNGE
jgi:hypothetical protein